jgi:tetrahydromethanopterin S-methyltransferase subunit E
MYTRVCLFRTSFQNICKRLLRISEHRDAVKSAHNIFDSTFGCKANWGQSICLFGFGILLFVQELPFAFFFVEVEQAFSFVVVRQIVLVKTIVCLLLTTNNNHRVLTSS